jgi:hypothetical protein
VSRPRRKYGSPEAILDALNRSYTAIWKEFVESAEPPKALYHYCPEQALPKILASRKLWCSDILRMNDETEIVYGYDEIIGPIALQGLA